MKGTPEKRWLIILGTIIVQIGLGTIYTWSLFNQPLESKFGLELSKVAITFSITTFALAVSTLVAGRLQDILGIRKLVSICGLVLGMGLILTSKVTSLAMLYITAGIIVGAADGIAYITCLSNCIKWFPDRKGLASGISVGAYGTGSLLFKYINGGLITSTGVSGAFLYWGIIIIVLILAGAMLLKDAPIIPSTSNNKSHNGEFTIWETLKTKEAYILFAILFSSCMSGLYLIGIVKDIGVNLVGLSSSVAASAITIVAIFNTGGRIILGALSDKFSRLKIVAISLIVTATSVFALSFASLNYITFFMCVGSIAFCFGGNITVLPAIVGDFFGLKNQTKNYGAIYQGFGLGAISASIIEVAIGFMPTFIVIGVLCLIAATLAVTVKPPKPINIAK